MPLLLAGCAVQRAEMPGATPPRTGQPAGPAPRAPQVEPSRPAPTLGAPRGASPATPGRGEPGPAPRATPAPAPRLTPPPEPGLPARPPAPVLTGQLVVEPGRRPGAVVAAPHGTSDLGTGAMATEIARRTGLGLVVATGFGLEADGRGQPGRRFQVNRPFEGVPGRPPAEETATATARRVYQAYELRVREAAQGPLEFYVEIHGNDRPEAADRIEVATVGVGAADAVRLRALLELIRDAHLAAAPPGAPRLAVAVEPADPLRFTASGAKRDGILRLPRRALHLELPRVARTEWRALYTGVLADFVGEAVVLPPGS